jgi:hypothetical protein
VALGADAWLGRTPALLALTAVLATVVGVASYIGGREFQQSRVAAGASSTPSADPAQPPAGTPAVLSEESRALARSAAVRLIAPANGPVGSGSIISADGLILTSAHVAAPTAPGLALLYGGVQTLAGVAPDGVLVSVSPGGDGPATPTFTAEVLAVDGYLDLAVLRIVADAQGRPLPNGTTFPFVPLGSIADVDIEDDLTVFGFPSGAGGEVVAVAPGSVRAFLPDPRGRAPEPRFLLDTTADFSTQSSGGMAVDNAGRLVGVASTRPAAGDPAGARVVRAAGLALPLVRAATDSTAYVPPYLTPGTGREQAEDLGWTLAGPPCPQDGRAFLDGSSAKVVAHVFLRGMARGEDVVRVLRRDGEPLRTVSSVWDADEQGCLATELSEVDVGRGAGDGFQEGNYSLEVYVGPEQQQLTTTEVTLTPDS